MQHWRRHSAPRMWDAIFAGGPRHRTPDGAAKIFAELAGPRGPRRVGVFATADAALLAPAIEKAGLDVIQLHGDPTPSEIASIRRSFDRQIWAVVRCRGGALPDGVASLWDVADGVLLDAHVDGRLGGTGVALPWQALSNAVHDSRARAARRGQLVLAGGLTPDNVRQAIRGAASRRRRYLVRHRVGHRHQGSLAYEGLHPGRRRCRPSHRARSRTLSEHLMTVALPDRFGSLAAAMSPRPSFRPSRP